MSTESDRAAARERRVVAILEVVVFGPPLFVACAWAACLSVACHAAYRVECAVERARRWRR